MPMYSKVKYSGMLLLKKTRLLVKKIACGSPKVKRNEIHIYLIKLWNSFDI